MQRVKRIPKQEVSCILCMREREKMWLSQVRQMRSSIFKLWFQLPLCLSVRSAVSETSRCGSELLLPRALSGSPLQTHTLALFLPVARQSRYRAGLWAEERNVISSGHGIRWSPPDTGRRTGGQKKSWFATSISIIFTSCHRYFGSYIVYFGI